MAAPTAAAASASRPSAGQADKEFKLPFSKVSITGYRVREPGPHTIYFVEVHPTNGEAYMVARRYRQFHVLRSELRVRFPHIRVHGFPEKKWVGNLSPAVLDQRREALHAYLQQISKHEITGTSQPLIDFLTLTPQDKEEFDEASKVAPSRVLSKFVPRRQHSRTSSRTNNSSSLNPTSYSENSGQDSVHTDRSVVEANQALMDYDARMREKLVNGHVFMKHTRTGKQHLRYVYCSSDLSRIQWTKPNAHRREDDTALDVEDIREISIGKKSAVFERSKRKTMSNLCFSILTDERTLDLQTYTSKERDEWVEAFRFLLELNKADSETEQEMVKKLSRAIDRPRLISYMQDPSSRTSSAPVRVCVQCGLSFMEPQNSRQACRFHPGNLEYKYPKYKFTCCGQLVDAFAKNHADHYVLGCSRNTHRVTHHTDYPYHRYQLFANDTSKHIKQEWLLVERPDFKDNEIKSVQVGLRDDDKVYVKIDVGLQCKFVHSWTFASLQALASATATRSDVIHEIEDSKDGWIIRARWLFGEDKIVGVELFIKTSHETKPTVSQLELLWQRNKVVKGRVTQVSTGEGSYSTVKGVMGGKKYKLPKREEKGPSIEVTPSPIPKQFDPEYAAEFPLRIELRCAVRGDQVMSIDGGPRPSSGRRTTSRANRTAVSTFDNQFVHQLEIKNRTSEPIALDGVKAAYISKSEWQTMNGVLVGLFAGHDINYLVRDGALGNEDIVVPGKGRVTVLVTPWLTLKGNPGESRTLRARAHNSLPQPLRMKLTFAAGGKTAVLMTEFVNPELDLPTRAAMELAWKKPISFWAQADDTSAMTRTWLAIYRDTPLSIVIRREGTYYTYDDTDLRKLAYDASQSKTGELELLEHTEEGRMKVVALIDVKDSRLYGFKVSLKTSTSSVTDACFVP